MRRIRFAQTAVVLVILAFAGVLLPASDDTPANRRIVSREILNGPRNWAPYNPIHDGKPLSYWLKIIQQRNEEMMPLAFDAIRELGPDAWPAVPGLTRVITSPFSPIRVGRDSEELISSKLYDIQIRADAIDALVSIGDAAASATVSLIRWALMVRVIPSPVGNSENDELFIEFTAMDAVQRMRVIDAVAAMGDAAMPTIERLLRVPDDEIRKTVVAILGGDALFMAEDLLKSSDCQDRKLGFAILKDMDLIVAKQHLRRLSQMVVCDPD